MGLLLERTNAALDINPPQGAQHLTVHGSDWLWAVTAIYICSFLAFAGLSFVARAGEKIFHYIFIIALLVGSISYYAIASDVGWTDIATSDQLQNGSPYQVFFAKYVNWVVAFPSLIIALGLISGVSWTTIVYNIFLSWTWVVSYLCSAYTDTNYKWGFFAFGTAAYILLGFSTLFEGSRGASRVGIGRDHWLLAGWLNLVWLLYPVAFGLSDGGNRIGVTPEFIFFGILDVLTVPLLSFAFLFLGRRWDYGSLNLAFTQYGRVNAAGGHFPEKNTTAHNQPAPAPAAPAGGPVSGEAV